MNDNRTLTYTVRAVALAAAMAAALVTTAPPAEAENSEIVPMVGLSRSPDSDNDAEIFGSLAFRHRFAPILLTEIDISYRSEDYYEDQLHLRMWPITASLYLSPVPSIYAGAGVGFYNLTLDYEDNTEVLEDQTSQEFGVHLGGGLQVPLAPSAAIDLNGRYVFIQDQENDLVPDTFDPDFWATRVGVAFKF